MSSRIHNPLSEDGLRLLKTVVQVIDFPQPRHDSTQLDSGEWIRRIPPELLALDRESVKRHDTELQDLFKANSRDDQDILAYEQQRASRCDIIAEPIASYVDHLCFIFNAYAWPKIAGDICNAWGCNVQQYRDSNSPFAPYRTKFFEANPTEPPFFCIGHAHGLTDHEIKNKYVLLEHGQVVRFGEFTADHALKLYIKDMATAYDHAVQDYEYEHPKTLWMFVHCQMQYRYIVSSFITLQRSVYIENEYERAFADSHVFYNMRLGAIVSSDEHGCAIPEPRYMADIRGLSMDPSSRRAVLMADSDGADDERVESTRRILAELWSVKDRLAAYKDIGFSLDVPGLDEIEGDDRSKFMKKQCSEPALFNTHVMDILYRADVALKQYTNGGMPVRLANGKFCARSKRSVVPGYVECVEKTNATAFMGNGKTAFECGQVQAMLEGDCVFAGEARIVACWSRIWPDDSLERGWTDVARQGTREEAVFDELVTFLNANMALIAQESPVLVELAELCRILALLKYAHDNSLDLDLGLDSKPLHEPSDLIGTQPRLCPSWFTAPYSPCTGQFLITIGGIRAASNYISIQARQDADRLILHTLNNHSSIAPLILSSKAEPKPVSQVSTKLHSTVSTVLERFKQVKGPSTTIAVNDGTVGVSSTLPLGNGASVGLSAPQNVSFSVGKNSVSVGRSSHYTDGGISLAFTRTEPVTCMDKEKLAKLLPEGMPLMQTSVAEATNAGPCITTKSSTSIDQENMSHTTELHVRDKCVVDAVVSTAVVGAGAAVVGAVIVGSGGTAICAVARAASVLGAMHITPDDNKNN